MKKVKVTLKKRWQWYYEDLMRAYADVGWEDARAKVEEYKVFIDAASK